MVDHELDELKREFLTEAAEKAREIESSVGDEGALERLAYLAHQLKGSGGSYGYAQISAEAAAIERAAEEARRGATPSDAMSDHVTRLRDEIDRSLSELG